MEESIIETITKMSELDNKHCFTVARIIENNKCVELHYDEGEASIEYGIKDENNTWNDKIDTNLEWFRLDLTDEEILEILDKKFNEYFPESENEKFEAKFYTEDEIRKLIESKAELYYADDGVDEVIIKLDDIPDFIVEYNRKIDVRDLKFMKLNKGVFEYDITTNGEYLNKIKPELREKIIDRLVALQTNEVEPRKFKLIDENIYEYVQSKIEQEKEQKKSKNKNREAR